MFVLLALGCSVLYGIADYCGGRASRTMPSVVVTVTGQMVSLALIGVLVVLGDSPAPGGESWAWGLGGGLAGAVGLTCFYHALSRGVMSVVAPTTAVVAVSIPVVVGLLDGERPGLVAYGGMLLGIVAVGLVSGAVGTGATGDVRATPPRVLALAAAGGIGFGLLFVCLDRTDPDSGMWPLVAARLMSVAVVGALVVARRRTLITAARPFDRVPLRLSIIAGVLDMAANVLYLEAVRRGELSVVGVLSSLYPVSTVALAFLLDRERVSRSQMIGMAAAVAAVACVSW